MLDVLKHGRPKGEDGRAVRAHPDLVAPVVFAAVTWLVYVRPVFASERSRTLAGASV